MDSRARFRNRRFAMKLAEVLPLETRSLATEPIQIALSFTGLTALSLLPSARPDQSPESESGSTAWNPTSSPQFESLARTSSGTEAAGGGTAPSPLQVITPPQSRIQGLKTDSVSTPELDDVPSWISYEPSRSSGGGGSIASGGGNAAYVPPLTSTGGGNPFGSIGIDAGAPAPVLLTGSGKSGGIDPTLRSDPQSIGAPIGSFSGTPNQIALKSAYDPSTSKGNVQGSDPKQRFAMESFSNFSLYTLDYNNGVVLFPDAYQYANLNGEVDLRAQVKDATGVTFSWNTSGLTDAQNITGTNTYRLQFKWKNFSSGATNTVTLTATDSNNNQETQTYTFKVPAGSVFPWGASPTYSWPSVVTPDLAFADTPSFVSHNLAVDAYSGAVNTAIALPSYNPNISPLVFSYDSVNADPRPLILSHHILDPSQSAPTKVGAQLTFNSSAGTTYYYDTSEFTAGDFLQFSLQADATALSTGRYDYTVTMSDVRGSTTTTNVNGTMTVLNGGSSPFGAGWNLHGLEKITAATGGLIVDLGGGNKSLWYTGSGVGTYTSPAGEFSTLIKNGNNTYTRTLTDGTAIHYDTNGRQTSVKDLNDRRMTYAYDGGGKLSTVTDPYGQITTLTYDGNGKLSTVTDPASRVTTFTFSGTKMTGVTLPDTNAWTFSYDASARMTSVTDPRSKTVTVTLGGSGRVSSITRPDATTETILPYQVQGYDTSGTSMAPAPATLLAEAVASYTDPNSDETVIRPDWRGHGQPNQTTDANGKIASFNRDSNGLATVMIDRLNRISFAVYDSNGNITKFTNPDLTYREYGYASYSRMTHIRNERAKYTYPVYDGNGNLTSETDASGYITTLTYTGTGQVATIKDARNNVTTYQYDSYDRLTTITFADLTTKLFVYDSKGNTVTVTNERGYSTTYAYDAMNRVTGQTDALGNRTTYVYDASGNQTVVHLPLSRTITYTYDSLNRVTTVTNALNNSHVMGYDSAGNQTSFTDALSRTTTYIYDALGRRTAVVDPLGNRTTTVYDAEGQITVVRDPLNRATTTTYNERGWITTVKDPLSNVSTYTYSETGKVTRVSDPSNVGANLVSITYDNMDRQFVVDNSLGNRATYGYDEVGNTLGVKDPMGNNTTYVYDARNRLTTVTDPLNHTTVRSYDGVGNLVGQTDALGHTTTKAYDALDRVITITDPLSGVTTMSYDTANRHTGLTDPIGNRTTWAYDAADRLTTLTDANGTTTFAYDIADQLVDKTDSIGRRTTYAYDSAGRRTHERWFDGATTLRTVTTTYDAASQITVISDPDATLTFTYDNAGRHATVRTSSGSGQPDTTLTYGYNASGDRTTLVDNLASVGRTTYSYDLAHRLTTISRSFSGIGGPLIAMSYDNSSRLTKIDRSYGGSSVIRTTYIYDSASNVTTITHVVVGGSSLAAFRYGYDDANRLISENNAEGSVTYTYDNSSQLTSVTGARSESYDYDANGNRDSAGYTVGTGGTLTASPNTTYIYDTAGHLTSKNDTSTGKVTTFSYDHRDRLVGITRKTSGGTIDYQTTYTYDALNRRIAEQIDADGAGAGSPVRTWTVFDGENPYADFNEAGTLKNRYLYNAAVDALLARSDASSVTDWYLTDRLGSVRDIIDTSGTVLYHTGYDSFGNKVSSSGAGGDRFGFTGREHDVALNLYYYRARFYDPATGRFISKDPLRYDAGDMNLYRYVGNSPTNGTDPSGEIPVIPVVIGAVVGGITAWWSSGYNPKLIAAGVISGAVGGLTGGVLGSVAVKLTNAGVISGMTAALGIGAGSGLASGTTGALLTAQIEDRKLTAGDAVSIAVSGLLGLAGGGIAVKIHGFEDILDPKAVEYITYYAMAVNGTVDFMVTTFFNGFRFSTSFLQSTNKDRVSAQEKAALDTRVTQ